MAEVKSNIWSEAKKRPFFNKLKPADNYVLMSVGQDAQCHEYYDFTKRLCELKLFYLFFKLEETQGNLEEKMIDSNISKKKRHFAYNFLEVILSVFKSYFIPYLNHSLLGVIFFYTHITYLPSP